MANRGLNVLLTGERFTVTCRREAASAESTTQKQKIEKNAAHQGNTCIFRQQLGPSPPTANMHARRQHSAKNSSLIPRPTSYLATSPPPALPHLISDRGSLDSQRLAPNSLSARTTPRGSGKKANGRSLSGPSRNVSRTQLESDSQMSGEAT